MQPNTFPTVLLSISLASKPVEGKSGMLNMQERVRDGLPCSVARVFFSHGEGDSRPDKSPE